jgi:hypothetical protein
MSSPSFLVGFVLFMLSNCMSSCFQLRIVMPICFVGGSRFIYVIYIYYVYWCLSQYYEAKNMKTCNWTTWTTYQMVFVLVKCNTSLVEQKLITIPEHPTSSPIFSGVRVSQSLVVCVVSCRSLFVLLPFYCFYFGHCIVCPSIYGFWIPPLSSIREWQTNSLLLPTQVPFPSST